MSDGYRRVVRTLPPRLRAALCGLRVYGPCSIAELARRTGRERVSVYGAVYLLRDAGLARRLGPATYDVTGKARDQFGDLIAPPAPATPPDGPRQMDLFGEAD